MKTVTCKEKSTMEVLHELTALDKQESITLISWNGNASVKQVKDHIYEMIGVLKEDEFM